MFSPAHAAVGATLALIIPQPVLAIGAALGSHYILDSIPHGDEAVGIWLRRPPSALRFLLVETADLGLAALVTWRFVSAEPAQVGLIIAAVLAAILPDVLWGTRYVLDNLKIHIPVITAILEKHHQWHEGLHAKSGRAVSLWIGLLPQAAICASLLLTIR